MYYKVKCNYVEGKWVGKQIVPISDNYLEFEGNIRANSSEKVFGATLARLLKITEYKCVKIVNLTHEAL